MDILSMTDYNSDSCQVKKINATSFILSKKKKGYQPYTWLGRRDLEDGVYRVSFRIKANKQIPLKHDCGFKIHQPKEKMYNNFLSNLVNNTFCNVEIYAHINTNDLCCFIFDSFDDDLEVQIEDLQFFNMNQDTTIILQGVINDNVDQIKTINHYLKFGKIIVSSYFKDTPTYYWNIDPKNIHFIMNDFNGMKNELTQRGHLKNNSYSDNCFYQLKTTQNALKDVTTYFTVKTRIDTYFSNIGDMIEMMMNNQDKITSLSLYVRGFHNIKYHLSDIFFCAKTETIENVINLALDRYPVSYFPEVNIWYPYIMSVLKMEHNNIDDYVREMSKLFIIFPLNWNKKYSFRGITHLNDHPKSTEDCFRFGCDC